jgi:8-oxo-dGTP pyrophosphatase MutT (NUDIX family)
MRYGYRTPTSSPRPGRVLQQSQYEIFQTICRLINNITPEEKRLFCTFDFDVLFFYITNKKYNNVVFPEQLDSLRFKEYNAYLQANKLFYENIFLYKNRILDYINESYNKHVNLWQVPKGKKNDNETSLMCAIRELEEETSISPKDYSIMNGIKPIRFSTIIADTEYVCIYYVAVLKNNVSPRLKYRYKSGYIEVTDIRWVSVSKLELYISNECFLTMIKKVARYVKNRVKKEKYIEPIC